MGWWFWRLGIRAAVALGLAAVVFLVLSELEPQGKFPTRLYTAFMLFVYVALGASVLTLVRTGVLVAWRLGRRTREPLRRERTLWLFRGHAIVTFGGTACLASVLVQRLVLHADPHVLYYYAEVIAQGLFLAGLLLISAGWAFGSLGNAPGVARAIETSGA